MFGDGVKPVTTVLSYATPTASRPAWRSSASAFRTMMWLNGAGLFVTTLLYKSVGVGEGDVIAAVFGLPLTGIILLGVTVPSASCGSAQPPHRRWIRWLGLVSVLAAAVGTSLCFLASR